MGEGDVDEEAARVGLDPDDEAAIEKWLSGGSARREALKPRPREPTATYGLPRSGEVDAAGGR